MAPLADIPGNSYYAVIFSSVLRDEAPGYAAMAGRMLELAARQPGFLGVESARGADGTGITVSYWESEAAIRAWREQAEHSVARRAGRSTFYVSFRLRVARIERSDAFDA